MAQQIVDESAASLPVIGEGVLGDPGLTPTQEDGATESGSADERDEARLAGNDDRESNQDDPLVAAAVRESTSDVADASSTEATPWLRNHQARSGVSPPDLRTVCSNLQLPKQMAWPSRPAQATWFCAPPVTTCSPDITPSHASELKMQCSSEVQSSAGRGARSFCREVNPEAASQETRATSVHRSSPDDEKARQVSSGQGSILVEEPLQAAHDNKSQSYAARRIFSEHPSVQPGNAMPPTLENEQKTPERSMAMATRRTLHGHLCSASSELGEANTECRATHTATAAMSDSMPECDVASTPVGMLASGTEVSEAASSRGGRHPSLKGQQCVNAPRAAEAQLQTCLSSEHSASDLRQDMCAARPEATHAWAPAAERQSSSLSQASRCPTQEFLSRSVKSSELWKQIRVPGNGRGGGAGSYLATVKEGDQLTLTVVRTSANPTCSNVPDSQQETHVLKVHCQLATTAESTRACLSEKTLRQSSPARSCSVMSTASMDDKVTGKNPNARAETPQKISDAASSTLNANDGQSPAAEQWESRQLKTSHKRPAPCSGAVAATFERISADTMPEETVRFPAVDSFTSGTAAEPVADIKGGGAP
eukprot:TRINITY_DN23403_c0_g1_i1.p1 TRINITY_DN23403_c0_g1~~TRINITY_DN23403_c0_g1_i1.p1  ORF type:complete len:597 (-),score=101.98 TRINITY_DN23403_c0_g1_i1:700-2490(-)